MQGKGTTHSTFDQLFEPIFSRNFRQLLQKLEVDKYVKKLTAFKFIILSVFLLLIYVDILYILMMRGD